MGPDQHAVATRFVGWLHNQVLEVVEDVVAVFLFGTAVGRHVGEDRLLAEEVADHVRHVGVDDLVVRDAAAGSVGKRDVARLPGAHQSGYAQHRFLAERLRVQEEVVDAPVNDVDPLETADCAHVHAVVLRDHEVGALDEFGRHFKSQVGVFEIRRVVDSRGQHHDAG